MLTTIPLFPGITLRCFGDRRFKQGALSIQFVRPMCREEAGMNALLPAVLLRGCVQYPDLRSITWKLDALYGASVGTMVRRVGDYHTTGLACSFLEERFVLPGEEVTRPMVDFLRQLLWEPVCSDGVFREAYVEGEKNNLISTLQSQRNDKRAYAVTQMLRDMCREDSYGISRLGEEEQVAAITPRSLYDHYLKVLKTSPVELFYVGGIPAEEMAELLRPLFAGAPRELTVLPPQTGFHDVGGREVSMEMDITQGKLVLGYTTPITLRDPDFAAMQVLNLVLGGGMSNKLFNRIREARSLCYDIGSSYRSAKGIVIVSAGIHCKNEATVREEIAMQISACRQGDISQQELEGAKQLLRASLLATHDSPGAIESYYATKALSGQKWDPEAYIQAVESVTREQAAAAARSLQLHTGFFLKGVGA